MKELLLKEILIDYIRGPFGSSLKKDDMTESGIPVYEQQHAIYGSRDFRYFISNEKFKMLKRFQVKTNDIIISCSGTIGSTSIIKDTDEKGIINQALLILRVDSNIILPEYLMYYLKTYKGKKSITISSVGSVQENIAPRKVIENIKIKLPSIKEQIEILNKIKIIDNKIKFNNELSNKINEYIDLLYIKWFAKFNFQENDCQGLDVELKYSKFLKKEIPSNWETGLLSDIAQFSNGKKRPDTTGEIPVYGGNGVLGYTNESNSEGAVSIIGRVGEYCGNVYYENRPVWVSDNAIVSKSKDEHMNIYLYLFMKNNNLNRYSGGSGQPLMTQDLLKRIKVLLPKKDIILKFNSKVELLLNKSCDIRKENKSLYLIKEILVNKYIF